MFEHSQSWFGFCDYYSCGWGGREFECASWNRRFDFTTTAGYMLFSKSPLLTHCAVFQAWFHKSSYTTRVSLFASFWIPRPKLQILALTLCQYSRSERTTLVLVFLLDFTPWYDVIATHRFTNRCQMRRALPCMHCRRNFSPCSGLLCRCFMGEVC